MSGDLISRDAVMLRVREFIGNPTYNENMLVNDLNALPSAEPERKIIYCKDCRFAHLKGEVKYCDVWKTYLSQDDFCSSAEKRGE